MELESCSLMAFKTTVLSFSRNAALSKNLFFSFDLLISGTLFLCKDSTASLFSDSVLAKLNLDLAIGSDTTDFTDEKILLELSVAVTASSETVEYSSANDPLLIGNSGSLEKMFRILLPAASTLSSGSSSTLAVVFGLIGMMIGSFTEELSVVIVEGVVVFCKCAK